MMLKERVIGCIAALISLGILYWTWYEAQHKGIYYLKAALFTPIFIVLGMFLIFFPQFYGKPETTRQKIVVLAVFAIGVMLGLYNLYLINL